jgi:hypothetical protein
MNRYLRTILAASVAVPALVLVGCSSTKSEPTFSTDGADELALKMIPEAQVLPGTGWSVVSENDFSAADEDYGDLFLEGNEHCDLVTREFSSLDRFDEEERRGRAERTFEVTVDGQETVEVQVTADIYASASGLRVASQSMDRIFAESAFGQCLVAVMESLEDDTTTVEATDHVPTAVAPRQGWEIAVGWDVAYAEGEEVAYMETYAWRIGNAMVSVTLSGPKERLTDSFVAAILERVDGTAVVAAAES